MRHVRKFITEFIELLQEKNGQDQLQEFLWCAGKARVGLDAQDLVQTATNSKARADARAGNKQILITSPFTVADMIFIQHTTHFKPSSISYWQTATFESYSQI